MPHTSIPTHGGVPVLRPEIGRLGKKHGAWCLVLRGDAVLHSYRYGQLDSTGHIQNSWSAREVCEKEEVEVEAKAPQVSVGPDVRRLVIQALWSAAKTRFSSPSLLRRQPLHPD